MAMSAEGNAVTEKSSTERPSSAPEALKSSQRIQKLEPVGIESPVITEESAVRLPAALPSIAPTAATTLGLLKSSALTSVHVPVVRLVAFRLYWKSSRSGPRLRVPSRHSSP